MFIIASHNNGESARALADMLNCRLMANSDKPLPKKVQWVINFGCSNDNPKIQRAMLRSPAARIWNLPGAVTVASSKADTFRSWDGNGFRDAVPHYFSADEANYHCLVNGKSIVARTLDRAAQGRGIELITPDQARAAGGLPPARVYTEAINKGREYRVHVGRIGNSWRVIDVTRKIRRPGVDDTNRPFIWNSDNDFIFVRDGVNPSTIPRNLRQVAMQAVNNLGLDFGAVDIVVPRRGHNRIADMPCYALEVNTAPGMEGTTLRRYAEYFTAMVTGRSNNYPDWGSSVEGTPNNQDD